jgi:hypothetical protein
MRVKSVHRDDTRCLADRRRPVISVGPPSGANDQSTNNAAAFQCCHSALCSFHDFTCRQLLLS